ncbi:helix-turn-helix domain-containing protein [Hymenobacter tibetensis]|uniref:Helix-turn-helix domain-containing protein n=1 Tax=Hymenobacter tibetensis TaxID=497967 RepID=A0ABY4D2M2_9BACT|nr:helix-turn-helix domain-containing protein [Hymenobacter tibetensis]UOG76788.1 helix-turn-helix domain-containing protein [Hymenobacter tibetensis]
MKASESIDSFLETQGYANPMATSSPEVVRAGRFNVYDVEQLCAEDLTYNRRDFYKVSLLRGVYQFNYADRGVRIDCPALIFSNPLVPYSCEVVSETQTGYFCLFTEEFLSVNDRSTSLQDSPLFKIGNDPIFFPNEGQYNTLHGFFQQLMLENNSTYAYKQDLLRNYLNLIIHEALKMQPQKPYYPHQNAASRIVALFTELLERQFPIDSPGRPLKLRTASDFANCLSVHVNHLNRAVRELTGKTTTVHIAERIISEAKALLQHTDWSVTDVAYGLGFEYPTYFNNFFKKHTGLTPKALRA